MISKGSGLLSMLVVASLLVACGDDDELNLTGPGYAPGDGRMYPVHEVVFTALDGIPVSAVWGTPAATGRVPVVILLHDLDGNKYDWLTSTTLFVDLLESGYAVIALDHRGHGATPLPGGRAFPVLQDLEVNHRDVLAALDWLSRQTQLDASRVALVGSGLGGNSAYVGKGAFPGRVSTAISISPGLWQLDGLRPVVVGAGIDPFTPESILFIVAENDIIRLDDDAGTVLSYLDFSRSLKATTAAPARVHVVPGSSAHGLELIERHPAVLREILLWLEEEL